MNVLRKFYDLINRDGSAHDDPDEPVELALVPGVSGPMIVERLRGDGFDVTGYETCNGTGMPGEYRILVRRGHLGRAVEAVEGMV